MYKIDKEAIREVMMVAKRMDDKNFVNSLEGNISVKKDGLVYITPTGKNKAFLTEDCIAVFNEDGEQVAGKYPPSSEFPMHSNTYLMREGIGGVVHAHTPYLTAYAICNKVVETKAYPEMMWEFKQIEIAPYGTPGSDAIWEGIKPILDKGRVVLLLSNHGALAVGENAVDAMNRLEAAEATAKVLMLADQLGQPANLPDEECELLLSL